MNDIKLTNAYIMFGDAISRLKELPDNSVDSIITDPPYGLSDNKFVAKMITEWVNGNREFVPNGKGFMGKEWDRSVPPPAIWDECLRVLKPGGHLLAFFGSRTQDIGALSIRLAGFEIRDSIAWIYGSGFPKSMNISKAIDKEVDLETEDAEKWQGWGTALKPAIESIIVARKPISEKTIASNVIKWGTGGINIDESRIGEEVISTHNAPTGSFAGGEPDRGSDINSYTEHTGRFPANIIFDEYTADLLDEQADASRFFYVAKTSKKDRNEGLETLPEKQTLGGGGLTANIKEDGSYDTASAGGKYGSVKAKANNFHPTVKPTKLMEYLIKLVTPEGGTVLDPFTGSGSTGKAALLNGFKFIGCELTEDYLPIIKGRLTWAQEQYEEKGE